MSLGFSSILAACEVSSLTSSKTSREASSRLGLYDLTFYCYCGFSMYTVDKIVQNYGASASELISQTKTLFQSDNFKFDKTLSLSSQNTHCPVLK